MQTTYFHTTKDFQHLNILPIESKFCCVEAKLFAKFTTTKILWFFLSFFQPQILQNFCELMNVDILQLLCCSTDGRHQSNNVIQSLMLLKDAFLIYAYNNAGYDDLDDC